MTGFWAIPAIILAAAIVSDVWRVLGALVASRIDEASTLYSFVKAVATALIAAIVAQFVLFPTGAMAGVPLWLRVGSMAAGFDRLSRDKTVARRWNAGLRGGSGRRRALARLTRSARCWNVARSGSIFSSGCAIHSVRSPLGSFHA